MDTATLVKAVEGVVASFTEEHRPLEWAYLVPNDVQFYNTEFCFAVYAPWLKAMPSMAALSLVHDRIRSLMSNEAMARIDWVKICDADDEYRFTYAYEIDVPSEYAAMV
jgi:hypothetical protein